MTSLGSKTEFLEAEMANEIEDLQKLLQEVSEPLDNSQVVVPQHGFCVKIKDDSGGKIFLNFCHCPEMPSPETLSEDELKRILESDDPSTYRIPLSLGEPHKETDKGGQVCLAYDIIVSASFYKRIEDSELFRVFLVTVGIQGLEDKYNMTLSKDDWVILKNKRYHGVMPKHCIRKAPKVTEISGSSTAEKKTETVLEQRRQPDQPDWVLLRPKNGSTLEARFLLDKINSEDLMDALSLELNLERLVLKSSPHYGDIDVCLPNRIDVEDCKAIYRKKTKILHLKMPIQESKLVML